MAVCVYVGAGVNVRVGSGVSVGNSVGMDAINVAVDESLSACTMAFAVSATTVGRYSGGYGVGTGLEVWGVQPATNPRREARMRMVRFMKNGMKSL